MAKMAGWKKTDDKTGETYYDCNVEFPVGASIPPGTSLKLSFRPNDKKGNDKAPDIRGEFYTPKDRGEH